MYKSYIGKNHKKFLVIIINLFDTSQINLAFYEWELTQNVNRYEYF